MRVDTPEKIYFKKGHIPWNKGVPRSEEVKRKISLSLKGKRKGIKFSEEHKRNIGLARLGMKMPFSTRIAILKSHLGKPLSEEHKKKISLGNMGRKISKWHKKKLSETKKGIKLTKEHRKHIGDSHRGKRKPLHSERTKKKISNTLRKLYENPENHPNWQGGKTKHAERFRKKWEYKFWRKSVFERDNYTCQLCGIRSGIGISVFLEADHIKPFAYFPELRLDINNGRTLCRDCHRNTDTYMGRAKHYQKIFNSEQKTKILTPSLF